jgi:hypothetical protein
MPSWRCSSGGGNRKTPSSPGSHVDTNARFATSARPSVNVPYGPGGRGRFRTCDPLLVRKVAGFPDDLLISSPGPLRRSAPHTAAIPRESPSGWAQVGHGIAETGGGFRRGGWHARPRHATLGTIGALRPPQGAFCGPLLALRQPANAGHVGGHVGRAALAGRGSGAQSQPRRSSGR